MAQPGRASCMQEPARAPTLLGKRRGPVHGLRHTSPGTVLAPAGHPRSGCRRDPRGRVAEAKRSAEVAPADLAGPTAELERAH
eukprot:scaffold1618_cov397-Prasinococcus_capsulatus_cf.AAC.2